MLCLETVGSWAFSQILVIFLVQSNEERLVSLKVCPFCSQMELHFLALIMFVHVDYLWLNMRSVFVFFFPACGFWTNPFLHAQRSSRERGASGPRHPALSSVNNSSFRSCPGRQRESRVQPQSQIHQAGGRSACWDTSDHLHCPGSRPLHEADYPVTNKNLSGLQATVTLTAIGHFSY